MISEISTPSVELPYSGFLARTSGAVVIDDLTIYFELGPDVWVGISAEIQRPTGAALTNHHAVYLSELSHTEDTRVGRLSERDGLRMSLIHRGQVVVLKIDVRKSR